MFKYIFLVFISMVLPSMGVAPQELINREPALDEKLLLMPLIYVSKLLLRPRSIEECERMREHAKLRGDVHTVQDMTEYICNGKKNLFERHYILTPLIAAGIAWCGSKLWRIRSCSLKKDACLWQGWDTKIIRGFRAENWVRPL